MRHSTRLALGFLCVAAALLGGLQLGKATYQPPQIVTVVKLADESVTSNTTLQNDDELLLPIASNQSWAFRCAFLYTAAATTGRIKAAVTVPSGTVRWVNAGLTSSATTNSGSWATAISSTSGTDNGFFAGAGTGTAISFDLVGYVSNGGSAGNIQMQWAQRDSSGTATTVLRGSQCAFTRMGS